MATLIYANGVLEELVPNNITFIEEELINIFPDFKKLKSKRLYEIPNTWCLWGENVKIVEQDYNPIGAEIIEENIFSPILLIHDSELNPQWNVSENNLYNDYSTFKKSVLGLIDSIAEDLINEKRQQQTGKDEQQNILLDAMGVTKDKRLLFMFKLEKQSNDFYKNDNYKIFLEQIYNYLVSNFIPQKPFIIYADNKMVVSIEDKDIDIIFDKILDTYTKKEDYEACTKITNIKKQWHDCTDVKEIEAINLSVVKPKRKYTKKSKPNKETES